MGKGHDHEVPAIVREGIHDNEVKTTSEQNEISFILRLSWFIAQDATVGVALRLFNISHAPWCPEMFCQGRIFPFPLFYGPDSSLVNELRGQVVLSCSRFGVCPGRVCRNIMLGSRLVIKLSSKTTV